MTERCDCCGSQTWEAAFSEGRFTLQRCTTCGLYAVSPMPRATDRITEIHAGRFASEEVATIDVHYAAERARVREFRHYVALGRRLTFGRSWLDIGCGTGTLLSLAHVAGFTPAGIELNDARRAIAARKGITVYDRPLEALDLPPESFAVVSLINVFSHLLSPAETLRRIHDILVPGGVLILHTGEIGPGAQKRHSPAWSLGDHLHWLGLDTIDRYAAACRYNVIHHERQWAPAATYSRERMRVPGRSRVRNAAKRALAAVPGALPAVRFAMTRRHHDNPVHIATIVLQRT